MSQSRLISGSNLSDCELVRHKMNHDLRGHFTEVYRTMERPAINFSQWSIVRSVAKVFRGMHYHNRHNECFCLISGKCLVGLKDLRPESPTYLKSAILSIGREGFELNLLSSRYFAWLVFHRALHSSSGSL